MRHLIYRAVAAMLPPKIAGRVDYWIGHHRHFYPYGSAMNGQTARAELVREMIFSCKPTLLVETGTFRGTTAEWFAGFGIPMITIEVNKRFCEFSRLRLSAFKHVEVKRGNSVEVMEYVRRAYGHIDRPIFFYLDAHWEEYLPLRKEIELIFRDFKYPIVLIDDFRVEGDDGYGFDSYGPGKSLTMDYVLVARTPKLFMFFPSVEGKFETGLRRGCVIITSNPELADKLNHISLLRRWP
jgi:hypothetical protein